MAAKSKAILQPLDRVAIALIAGLGLPLGLLLYGGSSILPRVQSFSWQDRAVGAEDVAFVLTFNRPMHWDSVAQNLQITPPLAGKFSTAGRRFVYTLERPIPYGQSFQIELTQATTLYRGESSRRTVQPFSSRFRSRDRAFVYIGVGGAEDGRLVLKNLTRQQTHLLTPAHWVVTQFKPYPEGDRLLVGAVERQPEPLGNFEQQLYEVGTGLGNTPVGQHRLLLDNATAQILKFDLSANGQSIVVQRYGRSKREPVGLWVLEENSRLRSLNHASGGDFLVTPDGSAVTLAEKQGISIVPLASDGTQAPSSGIEYLPQLGVPLGFSRDASAATMMKFNPDSTRSLFWVTQLGMQKELLKTNGYILQTQFDPTNRQVFCLYTRLTGKPDSPYSLHLSAVDVRTGQQTELMHNSKQASGRMSLAPDGSAILLEDVFVAEQSSTSILRDTFGQAITQSQIWELSLAPEAKQPTLPTPLRPAQPSNLGLSGIQPTWLP